MKQLVLASNNAGKLEEFRHYLQSLDFELRPQSEFNVIAPEETGATFIENALIKAREAARVSGLPALGDDSGLVVDALDGKPGIRSARFAGEDADDAANNALLLEALDGYPEARRGAAFYCCLVRLNSADDPAPLIVTGTWRGRILETPRGEGGFGYDPLFFDTRLGVSAAELPLVEKNRVSHRGQALNALVELLEEQPPAGL